MFSVQSLDQPEHHGSPSSSSSIIQTFYWKLLCLTTREEAAADAFRPGSLCRAISQSVVRCNLRALAGHSRLPQPPSSGGSSSTTAAGPAQQQRRVQLQLPEPGARSRACDVTAVGVACRAQTDINLQQ
ncbi:uncharacterized protein V6R79_014765 [Siganus canaliculatus]